MPDVKDLDHAAEEAIGAAYWNMGENCTANSRIMVHKDIKDEFTEIFLEKVAEMTTGDPLDPDNDMGAFAFVAGFAAIMLMIFLKIAGQG